MKRIYVCVVWSAMIFCVAQGIAQERFSPRVDALRSNVEYMALIKEGNTLSAKDDSLTMVLNKARAEYEADRDNAQKYYDRITGLESQIFDVHGRLSELSERTVSIEQDWLIAHPNDVSVERQINDSANKIVNGSIGEDKANLVYNAFFKDNLSDNDYSALIEAQDCERAIDVYLRIYKFNYGRLGQLDSMYLAATDVNAADSLYGELSRLEGVNRMIADTIALRWNPSFDTKVYSYNYILDKYDKREMLADFAAKLNEYQEKKIGIQGVYDNDDVASYSYAKPLLLYYEVKMADALSLYAARDSLNRVVMTYDEQYFIPARTHRSRADVEYVDIDVATPAKYSVKNPIPDCQVLSQGDVYRILLGNYASKVQPSTFKGVYPLCVECKDDGRYYYYAGVFPTFKSATTALERLHKLGFRQPTVVAWRDGEYGDGVLKPTKTTTLFRVEISADTLSDKVKNAISESAPEKDISRISSGEDKFMFIVGSFEEKIEADNLVDAIKNADDNLQVKVTDIEK